MSKLILIRHGLSEWNIEGRWQGLTDISLSFEGQQQIDDADEKIRGIKIDKIYESNLKRVIESELVIAKDLHLSCPVIKTDALRERDYGIYTGKNKWDFEKEVGENEFEKIRRGWTTPIPGGETMQDVYNRVVPYFQKTILNDLKSGQNVLIISSGNTLRALMKFLDNLTNEEAEKLDIGFAEVIFKDFNFQ